MVLEYFGLVGTLPLTLRKQVKEREKRKTEIEKGGRREGGRGE